MKRVLKQHTPWKRRPGALDCCGERYHAAGGLQLPDEIILEIVSLIDEERESHHAPWYFAKTVLQPALAAVCLLNRQWYDAAVGILYKDVFLFNTRSLAVFSHTMYKRKHLRPLAQSVFFTQVYSDDGNHWKGFSNWWDLMRVYELCPNLHSETLKKRFAWSTRAIPSALLDRSRQRYHHRISRFDINALTRLEVESQKASMDVFFTSDLTLAALEDLVVKNYHYYGPPFDGPFEWPNMPRLRRLCLRNCTIFSESISFPTPSPENGGLRALEIIGGSLCVSDPWEKLIAIGGSLELLTFAPSYFFNTPQDGQLQHFTSLVILRIPSRCFACTWLTPVILPPQLIHLITIEIPVNECQNLHESLDCVMGVINQRKDGTAYQTLETIRLNASVAEEHLEKYNEVVKCAEEVGIECTLYDIASKSNIRRFFDLIHDYLVDEKSADHAPVFYQKSVLQPALANAAKVNAAWNEEANRVLYDKVVLTSSKNAALFALALQTHPELRPLVNSFIFTRAFADSVEEWKKMDNHDFLKPVYDLCPNLDWEKVSSYVLYKDYHPSLWWNGEFITRLDIKSSAFTKSTLFPEEKIIFPRLEDLTIRNGLVNSEKGKPLVWPQMRNLRRLALIECYFDDPELSLPEIDDGPGLRELEILFTFLPEWMEEQVPVPFDGFPSVSVLRLDAKYFMERHNSTPTALPLPKQLVKLDVVGHREGFTSTTPKLEQARAMVFAILGENAKKGLYPHLDTIQLTWSGEGIWNDSVFELGNMPNDGGAEEQQADSTEWNQVVVEKFKASRPGDESSEESEDPRSAEGSVFKLVHHCDPRRRWEGAGSIVDGIVVLDGPPTDLQG
ncbi:uncharacterized protein FOMMEDRAFT_170432 [Fomitiporia mediterranea MF3/22]|uniref:uncharacterized protein n=1 Tax=Fomitiporia mediterranea (strain MF3/22) TaxID=694068 RepID=UPI0004408DC7|nr:uncharacterized protein FOMMEDRAFT_170432 [Fomitiporia mediterranea MF3/22]EJC99453.1 hypothetical protein FOMMEDRAFT_170432 [Fomitiporia mediterranea MF3/22]